MSLGNASRTIPVLVYHKIAEPSRHDANPNTCVAPAAFAAQMRLLRLLGYATPAPAEYQKAALGLPATLPQRPVLITFDDAFSSVAAAAAPVMADCGFTGAVFMVPSAFGGSAFWDGETAASPNRLLTPDELRRLAGAGWAVGAHSSSHTDLSKLAGEDLISETAGSKAALEAALGAKVDWFAYPYGAYSGEAKAAASRAGYALAFATEKGDGAPFAVPRRIISGRCGLFRFFLRLAQAGKLARA
ncbi:MAG: polysaccharide deacetylase family protein [Elusimicrobia bacterium]|nr:polysaccharide deacetylase family protein [Elusimicrobiota bacterium]